MNESLISVIVPIFKVEDYLNRCVESLIAQTYHNLEIILVDDGSTDTCPQLCDEWAEKDKRIKVIHKKNGGLSDARNAGIRAAEGEYILFVDSDDWVCADYAESLYRAVESSNSDICECDVIRTSGEIMPHYEGKEPSRWMAPRLSRRAHLTTKALSCRVSLATERRMLFSMS